MGSTIATIATAVIALAALTWQVITHWRGGQKGDLSKVESNIDKAKVELGKEIAELKTTLDRENAETTDRFEKDISGLRRSTQEKIGRIEASVERLGQGHQEQERGIADIRVAIAELTVSYNHMSAGMAEVKQGVNRIDKKIDVISQMFLDFSKNKA